MRVSTLLFSSFVALAGTVTAAPTDLSPRASGFVQRSGTHFALDGKNFYFFGTNAYWLSFHDNAGDIQTAFKTMASKGLMVCRVWGFNDVTSPSGIYYQSWSGQIGTVNYGSNGLGHMDTVVQAASDAGVKLIITLVNNWGDYGGMDVYVKQLGGSYHDQFYTWDTAKTAYKKYVNAVVSRYKASSAIMAWELCNECRCANGGGSGLSASSSCNTWTITNWASEMSAYIKSIDGNHLVSLGDEGFYNNNANSYVYSGSDGIDFDQNLQVSTLDFGTYHLYPTGWGYSDASGMGSKWITDHAASATKYGKPVIMEEYGLNSASSRDSVYPTWNSAVKNSATAGQMYWQYGDRSISGSPDDGYTVFDSDSDFNTLIYIPAGEMNAKNN
ncbi:glycoside hydrolase family 5 protein [Lophium mytilinum]|uniref:mannan endo-1,4-beta-mannosidase n=1 Tax=Lophium mytilinum TaxID=390894 RepID=A0A6A6QZX9_9PEZI|nr:glycoside hydrolase family 5 protein [Lophium mytilinum]